MASPTLYPIYYGDKMVTFEEMERRFRPNMHPEFARRLFPWLKAQGGKVGIGGGRRKVQPIKPGFAKPGRSFHQDQDFASGFTGYSAVDLVSSRAGRHMRWSDTDGAEEYGLHTFIKGEPWHMQCVEIRGWSSWVNAGRPDPDPNFLLPEGAEDETEPEPELPPFDPANEQWGLYPLAERLPVAAVGSRGDLVKFLQGVLVKWAAKIDIDGRFGTETAAAVADLQKFWASVGVKIAVDERVGRQTWPIVQFLAVAKKGA